MTVIDTDAVELRSQPLEPLWLNDLAGRQAVVCWGESREFGCWRVAATFVGVADLDEDGNPVADETVLVFRDLGLGEDGDENVGQFRTVPFEDVTGVVLLTDVTAEKLVRVVNGARIVLVEYEQ